MTQAQVPWEDDSQTFYAAMVTATCIVDVPSGALFLIPADPRLAKVIEASIQFHCATVLSDHNRSVAGLAPLAAWQRRRPTAHPCRPKSD